VTQAVTARQSEVNAARHQGKSAPRGAVVSGSGGEGTASQAEQSAAFVAATVGAHVVDRFDELLRDHAYYPQNLQRVVLGHDGLWKKAVAKAIQSLQSELHINDALQQYESFCKVGRELMLRELRSKAVRILAHKKRHKTSR
jgi:hypothetical protein